MKAALGWIVGIAGMAALALLWRQQVHARRAAQAEVARLSDELATWKRSSAASFSRAAARRPFPMPTGSIFSQAGKYPDPDPNLAAGLVSVLGLGNRGWMTPRDAFATQLWAARTGDVELEAGLLALTSDEKAALERVMAKLPPNIAEQYNTPERLLAFALAGSPHPVEGMAVLSATQDGPDDVVLLTQWQHTDDSIVHTSNASFHQDNGGWKWEVPPSIVSRVAAYLSRGN